MKLQQRILSHFNRREVKYLTTNAIGIAGLIIAMMAVLLSQDQTAMLHQIGQGLSVSPVGTVITSITSLF